MEQSKYIGMYTVNHDLQKAFKVIGEKRDEWLLCNGAGGTFYGHKNDYDLPKNVEVEYVDKTRKEEHYELWAGVEAFDIMATSLTEEEFIGFLKGNILKYQLRLGKKKGESVEKDLQKIETYKQILNVFL